MGTGQIHTCSQAGGTNPVVTAGTIATCYPTQSAAEAAAIAATTATDNCTNPPPKTAVTTGTPCAATITVTATDCAGNTASVAYSTRIDNTPPVATSDGPIAACYPTQGDAEAAALANSHATDNCPGTLTPHVSTTGSPCASASWTTSGAQ